MMPQNEALGIIIDSVILSLGGLGGIAGIIGGVFGFITWKGRKKFEEKIRGEVDKEIETHKAELQTTANELSQTLSEKITRRSKAYDFIIDIEYDFYRKFMEYSQNISSLEITIIHNIMYMSSGLFTLEDIEKIILEYWQCLHIIRNLHLCSQIVLNDNLTTFINEYINVLFEFGQKANTIRKETNIDALISALGDIQKKISNKQAKVASSISTIVKSESSGVEPNNVLSMIKNLDASECP